MKTLLHKAPTCYGKHYSIYIINDKLILENYLHPTTFCIVRYMTYI